MSGKGKRRSARLLKLEEEKNDGDSAGVCLLDPWQIIRNSISDNSTSQSSVGQIIEYILDELELRDRHELFAMPDDIQVTDYAERVSRPGDFATLRQKNKDGMYTALEQFENDVYMVFQRAITMNSQNTVPFREAMSLLDQAKQVFMSLKNNQMFSETELAAWRKRYLDQLQQPITPEGREVGNRGPPRHAAATPSKLPATTPRKKSAAETKKQENASAGAGGNTPENQRARQRGAKESKGTAPGKKARKAETWFAGDAATTAGAAGASVVARRRLTYNEGAGADQGWRTMARPVFQGRHVTFNSLPQEHTYRNSLHGFVRHAGLKARVAAEFRTLECVARARHSHVPQCWNGFAPGAGFLPPTPRPLGAAAAAAPEATPARPPSAADLAAAAPECKLETDEVLKLFVLMGTPAAFLERAKKMFGEGEREESARKDGQGQATRAADGARVGAATAAETGQKRGASEPSAAAAACGPFAPPKLVPGRLGFGQFAGSSAQPFKLKSKPSTSSNAASKKKIS
ncbi:uncharacterized protein LOC101760973 [Setaria italica]|uniref:uncharacterized protein LOC101760973 n=1 Tax=Setaria italica TaxID=4555 RepID=UPI0006478F95|nr:uncharacterized protein LOC101760973 [Setaria italica]